MNIRRLRLARLINLLVPGSGLIVLRREWLGLSIAILFAVSVQLAIFGLWIVPLDFPRFSGAGFAVAAIAVWAFAQWLTSVRIRAVSTPELARELIALRKRAAEAMERSDHAEARRELLLAMSVDDEDVESLVLWARLMSKTGRPVEAKKTWRRVIALATDSPHREEAQAGLSAS